MCSAPQDGGAQASAASLPAGVLHKTFELLEPGDLCRASAVCRLWRDLNSDVASDTAWLGFYRRLWPAHDELHASSGSGDGGPAGNRTGGWQAAFGRKMQQAKSWRGRARHDKLFGHTAGVRCVSLHVGSNLLFTGSLDRTVRAWDLANGVQLAVSRPHGGTVRCVAADGSLLVSGCSDHHIRAYALAGAGSEGASGSGKAGLAKRSVLPGGHTGPVTALELTPDALFSGSWDYSIRVWDRQRLRCTAAAHMEDWVSSLAAPGGARLYVGCGKEVLLYSVGSGGLQQAQAPVQHACGVVTAVRGSLDGRYLFFGTGEGAVVGVDLRCPVQLGQRVLLQDPSGVTGLGWEYPCLAASFQRGQVALLDAEAAMGQAPAPSCWVRWRSLGDGEPASCVALADSWAAVGVDSGIVATWDFSQALEMERAAAGLRQRKQQRRQAAAAARAEGAEGRRAGRRESCM